jgi:hypothetical protein
MDMYYTYAYLRTDGTPYYIGKGCRDRMNAKLHPGISLPPENRRIKLKEGLSNEESLRHEKYMIFVFGRKDLGTGILYNRTDGGEDPPRAKKGQINRINSSQNFWNNTTEEYRQERGEKISNAKKGKGNHRKTYSITINELNLTFQSVKECSEYINGDISCICKCLKGQGQTKHREYTFSRV